MTLAFGSVRTAAPRWGRGGLSPLHGAHRGRLSVLSGLDHPQEPEEGSPPLLHRNRYGYGFRFGYRYRYGFGYRFRCVNGPPQLRYEHYSRPPSRPLPRHPHGG